MIILNFSYPLSAEQVAQIEALAGEPVERIVDVPVAFDDAQAFAEHCMSCILQGGRV